MVKKRHRLGWEDAPTPFIVNWGVDIARFPSPEVRHPWDEPEAEEEGPSLEALRARLEPYLDRLPPRDADLLDLFFLRGCVQRDLAIVITRDGEKPLSQSAVSYIIARAQERLRYLIWLDTLDLDADRVRAVFMRLAEEMVEEPYRAMARRRAEVMADLWTTQSFASTGEKMFSRDRPESNTRKSSINYPCTVSRNHWERSRQVMLRAIASGDEDPVLLRVQTWTEGMHSGMLRPQDRSDQWRRRLSTKMSGFEV